MSEKWGISRVGKLELEVGETLQEAIIRLQILPLPPLAWTDCFMQTVRGHGVTIIGTETHPDKIEAVARPAEVESVLGKIDSAIENANTYVEMVVLPRRQADRDINSAEADERQNYRLRLTSSRKSSPNQNTPKMRVPSESHLIQDSTRRRTTLWLGQFPMSLTRLLVASLSAAAINSDATGAMIRFVDGHRPGDVKGALGRQMNRLRSARPRRQRPVRCNSSWGRHSRAMRMSLMRRVVALRRARSWARGLSSLTTPVESGVSSWAVPVTRCLLTTILSIDSRHRFLSTRMTSTAPRVRPRRRGCGWAEVTSPKTSPSHVAEFLRRNPEAKVKRVPRAGHSVQGDRPVELTRTIAAFGRERQDEG